MNRQHRLIAVVGPLAVLALACSTPAVPEPPSPDSTTKPQAQLPPRPRDVSLAGVDPCSLLTGDQQRRIGTDMPPYSGGEPDRFGNRYCAYDRVQNPPLYGYTIGPVTQEDASVYLTGQRNVVATLVSAGGFPAVSYRLPGDESGCFVAVSTDAGQYINVQYRESTGADDSADANCEKARVVAEMAVQTLLAHQ